MDRYIRCEKARAFRTLLVSWRPASASPQASNGSYVKSQEDSPFRLRRCRGTKYVVSAASTSLSVLYRLLSIPFHILCSSVVIPSFVIIDTRCRYIQVTHGNEALSADPAQLPNYTTPRPDDPLSGSGILFSGGIKDGDMTVNRLWLLCHIYASDSF